MLQNGMWMMADDYVNESTLTFTYNLSKGAWFNYNFVILDSLHGGIIDSLTTTYAKTRFLWGINDIWQRLGGTCWLKGVVVYEPAVNDTHIMLYSTRDWPGYRVPHTDPDGETETSPALPIFSVNKSVGEWLYDNRFNTGCTVGGYIDQQYIEETHSGNPQYWTTGVDAYNVIGNITIDKSPGDAIAIISNRYDGWWGETPGDSGAGAGVVLGIAKYFKDYNIKPKYNLSFLFTTGEEYGCRGAYHYRDSHPGDNVKLWIERISWVSMEATISWSHQRIVRQTGT